MICKLISDQSKSLDDVAVEILSGHQRLNGPTLIITSQYYRFFNGGVPDPHGLRPCAPVGGWRALTKWIDRREYQLVESLISDQRDFGDVFGDPAVFFSTLIAKLPYFALHQPPSGIMARRLLGENSEIRRMTQRIEFIYAAGRLFRVDVIFAAAFRYSFVIAKGETICHQETGRLLVEHERELVLFYREKCAARCCFVIEYERDWIRPRYLRSHLVGLARKTVVLDGWKFTRLAARLAREGLNGNASIYYETFLFVGPHKTCDAQIAKLHSSRVLPPQYSFTKGPPNHTPVSFDAIEALSGEQKIITLGMGPIYDNMSSSTLARPFSQIAIWTQMPFFERRFYHLFKTLVETLMPLSVLELPIWVYDELFQWSEIGKFLFEKWRIEAILSTLASCRRIRGARATSEKKIKQ